MAHKVEELPVFNEAQKFCVAVTAILDRSQMRRDSKPFKRTRRIRRDSGPHAGRLQQVLEALRFQGPRSIPDEGSGMRDFGSGIRDPGSKDPASESMI
jgi:hypothetical protein